MTQVIVPVEVPSRHNARGGFVSATTSKWLLKLLRTCLTPPANGNGAIRECGSTHLVTTKETQ
jgi:hypothetical protein